MQDTSWADGLVLVGDDDRLVGHVGVVPLRLLAENTGLRAGVSTAMTRRNFDPGHERGQVLIDLAIVLINGGESVSDFQSLKHLAPVIGDVASIPTTWRAVGEVKQAQCSRLNDAITRFRRHWWGLLAARPGGFPWLKVAGRELTGITVLDLDATVVLAGSEGKQNSMPTYKGGIGFVPNVVTCDNTDDVMVIDPRPGNATSNDASDNIWALDLAVARLPGKYRHRVLVRMDGAGFSHAFVDHVAAGGQKRGRHWEFSVGWSCTEREITAIEKIPEAGWVPGIDQGGDLIEGVRVADITGLLDTSSWTKGIRVIVREEPLHPKYRARATEREKLLGKRYQLIATNTPVGQISWLDARHRSHVHVEADIKQLKDLGLNKWPSKSWDFNVAWTQIVALAANLLACFRHLALNHDPRLRRATPKTLRHRLFTLPARLTKGQRKRYLHLRADWPWTQDLLTAWQAIKNLTPPT